MELLTSGSLVGAFKIPNRFTGSMQDETRLSSMWVGCEFHDDHAFKAHKSTWIVH